MPPDLSRAYCRARHKELRRALNAALVLLYERTAAPVAELASIAGVTVRDVYALVRRLDCRPRRPNVGFPGRSLGPRRELEPRVPLGDAEAVQALAAFRDVVRALREHSEARRAAELQRGIDRAQRRLARAQSRIALMRVRELAAAAAELVQEAAVEARMGRALWQIRRSRLQGRQRQQARETRREIRRRLQEQGVRDTEAATHRAHQRIAAGRAAAQRIAAAPPPATATRPEFEPVIDQATVQRIREIVADYDRRDRGPRIRSWD